jgi:hypothetical protein
MREFTWPATEKKAARSVKLHEIDEKYDRNSNQAAGAEFATRSNGEKYGNHCDV